MASIPKQLIGATGRSYVFKSLIQARPHTGRIWLAKSGNDNFVLKDIPKDIFENFQEIIQPRLQNNPYLRLPFDTIPNEQILVYKYLTADFLRLVREPISLLARKKVLKACLRGIAELHQRDIVHLDIKPDNILVNYRFVDQSTFVEQVQLIDLENAAYLPKGRCIKGMLAGNENWRSPEAHFMAELNKPSDIFSFGIVCLYAILGRAIFGADDDFQIQYAQGALAPIIRLQRQVSFFGHKEGLNGLMKHVGDEELHCQVLGMLWDERNEEHIPYKPFSDWPDVKDADLKDLIRGLMNLDPEKRLSAHQALNHKWFSGSEID